MAFTDKKMGGGNVPARQDPLKAQRQAAEDFARGVRRRRNFYGWISFALLVILPTLAGFWYYETRAANQYETTFQFAVRSNSEMVAADSLMGMLGGGSGLTGSDSYIVVEYLKSSEMVRSLEKRVGLTEIFAKPTNDPLHALATPVPIEDLLEYWLWMSDAEYDVSKGVVEVSVWAFAPEDSLTIAQETLVLADELVNELSRIAREEALQFADRQVATAADDLRRSRQAIQDFRNAEKVFDPIADAQRIDQQITALENEKIQLTTELETRVATGGEGGAAVQQIRERIAAVERQLVVVEDSIDDEVPEQSRIYEGLQAEYQIALQTYASALSARQQAEAVATQRQVYLSVYNPPRLAEASIYPDRPYVIFMLCLTCMGIWGIVYVVMLNIRDAMI
ncbi:MAG: hypothetical protein MRY63_08515 [Neomegalonema sp.]|nr:hypothetical protein [Neomegalonema sp.]